MTLADQPPVTRRFIFAQCADAADCPLSLDEYATVEVLLKDLAWAPTPHEMPEIFGKVETWQAQQVVGRRVRHG